MTIRVKGITDEDYVQYKKCSMLIAFPTCAKFRICENCHNAHLADQQDIEIKTRDIVERYMKNPLSEAIVFGGLEPIDSFPEAIMLVEAFRNKTNDDIIIYTGYDRTDVLGLLHRLARYPNIIMKFGNYLPNGTPIPDPILGVTLASENQYAEKIS